MKYCEAQTIDPGPLAAIELLEYLVRRQQPIEEEDTVDIDDVIDEWLSEACVARRRFRQVTIPGLRSIRRRAAMGLLAEDYQRVVERYANRLQEVPFIEMIDEVIEFNEVRDLFKRVGMRLSLITAIKEIVQQSGHSLRVDGETLILVNRQEERRIINDAASPSGFGSDSMLRLIARTWATKGRGLATLVVGPDGNNVGPDEISWTNGPACGLVYGMWFFDRDVRTLEDLRSLSAVEGNDGGVGALVAVIVVALGFLLTWIAKCIDDPDVAIVIRFIGEILSLGWIAHVASGVPIQECRTDPSTGFSRCARI